MEYPILNVTKQKWSKDRYKAGSCRLEILLKINDWSPDDVILGVKDNGFEYFLINVPECYYVYFRGQDTELLTAQVAFNIRGERIPGSKNIPSCIIYDLISDNVVRMVLPPDFYLVFRLI